MSKALSLFEGARLTMREAIELTIASLIEYGQRFDHWVIAYSGGKDSTLVVALIARLLAEGRISAPKSLTILYADTRQEIPPLHSSAMQMLALMRERGAETRVVLPRLEHRYWCYTLGRGVVFPSNRTRWCTPKLKVEPMLAALYDLREKVGGKFLMLTGVRLGESAARDARIVTSCSRDGAECGQGWYQQTTPEHLADTLAPILHWRVCHVWDYLMFEAPADGFETAMIGHVYGGDEAQESNARTGCVGCRLVSVDHMMRRVLSLAEWAYLAPLDRLRPLTDELMQFQNRLRKVGERRKDGTLAAKQGRVGPLTLDARRHGLDVVLAIQAEVNEAALALERPEVSIVDEEEERFIRQCISDGLFPDKWDGTEIAGNVLYERTFATGEAQPILDGLAAN